MEGKQLTAPSAGGSRIRSSLQPQAPHERLKIQSDPGAQAHLPACSVRGHGAAKRQALAQAGGRRVRGRATWEPGTEARQDAR